MSTYTLHIDFKNYWHVGGGRGGGAVVDAIVHRDSSGLPVVPGRHLKGLLRDALERASAWGWFDGQPEAQNLTAQLFGERSESDASNQSNEKSQNPRPGSLRISDARLPADLSSWLAENKGGAHLRPLLFRPLYQTAVDHHTGSAKNRSLRGIEATVPIALAAHIDIVPGYEPPANWPNYLCQVLPLIDAIGAYRTRGLGRAVLALEETA